MEPTERQIKDQIKKWWQFKKRADGKVRPFSARPGTVAWDFLKSMLVLFGATGLGTMFQHLGFTEANIITLYILGVLIISIITTSRIYSLVSSFLSVIIFNFLFTEPKYTLLAYDKGYPVTFLIMFLAAFITGTLAIKLKNHARESARTAYRTKILLDTNQLLAQAKSRKDIITLTSNQLVKLLGRSVVTYLVEKDTLSNPYVYGTESEEQAQMLTSREEQEAADWVRRNNKHAGATTDIFGKAECYYLAIRVYNHVYGVAGIEAANELDEFEHSMLLSILGECALALENEKNLQEKEEAAILAKNEQLRANLLRTISHDFRTPLTSISGNASNLMSEDSHFDEETKRRLYTDIYDDSMWLIGLVENLLSVTRIEDGKMNLHLSSELIEDVIAEALQHLNRKSVEHTIVVCRQEEILLARIDAKLIIQVIINIVDNAVKYTPAGSVIQIRVQKKGSQIQISIEDNGQGISAEDKEHIFDMFFRGKNKIADDRRGLGLGLALCKAIINAHGGEITVGDCEPRGTVFSFTLPAQEVQVHE